MSYDGDMKQVIRQAEEQGFTVRMTERGHYQFLAPDKKGIVVTSGTPGGGGRHWQNFMADMRRNGFDPTGGAATTSLGEAIVKAAQEAGEEARNQAEQAAKEVQKPMPRVGPPVSAIIRDVLKTKGDLGTTLDDLALIVNARRRVDGAAEVARNNISGILSQLRDRGIVAKMGYARWKIVESPVIRVLAMEDSPANQGSAAAPSGAAAEGAAAAAPGPVKEARTPPAGGVPGPPPTEVGVSVDDDYGSDADDIAKMDRLLQALSDAEDVVRRNREFVLKRRELRKVLAQLGALVKL